MEERDISYLLKLVNNEYYRNDREFLGIIKKLTSQTAKFNNKTISLLNILNEAEKTKLEMIKKEKELGLKENEKPYGSKTLSDIKNDSLIYPNVNFQIKHYADKFIYILDNFFDEKDLEKRKELLEEVEVILDILEENGINPLNFIINPNRAKVWHIIEHDYKSTLKKASIDLFIEKIRLTRLQHLDKVEALKEFYDNKKRLLKKIEELKKENKTEEIEKLEIELNKEIDFDIEPLLIDTHKIMESLDVMIEEIPDEIDEDKREELRNFMPIISEYYIDQIYALSGGVSYTPLSKHLKDFQKLIDNGASAKVLFEEVEKLQNTIQHLYILHWITEGLLKEILHCFHFSCSLGKTIGKYNSKFPKTKTVLEDIRKAVSFRNKVAHNGYLWKPIEIEISIRNYRKYVSQVVEERNFPFEEFYLEVLDRKIDAHQKEERFLRMLKEHSINAELISEELKNKLIQKLSKNKWKNKKYIMFELKEHLYQEFAKKYFNLDYEEVKKYLLLAEEKGIIKKKSKKSIMSTYTWTVLNQDNVEETKKNVKLMKKYIEEVSDIKFKRGFLGGFFGRK